MRGHVAQQILHIMEDGQQGTRLGGALRQDGVQRF
jgi:hypothetical protein